VKPSIIVIIVNYKHPLDTIECIKSLQTSESCDLGYIIIDNGSDHQDLILLQKALPQDALFHHNQENVGYVNAVNMGLKLALKSTANHILIINNDTVIDKYAVSYLYRRSQKYNDNCIVSGKVYQWQHQNQLQYIGSVCTDRTRLQFTALARNEEDDGQYDQVMELDLLDDIFWLVPRKVVEEIGYYNPLFWFNAEQADFALRAKEKGFKLIYEPKAMLWHKGSLSIGGRSANPVLTYWNSQSNMILRYLHQDRAHFWRYYVSTILKLIVRLLILTIRPGSKTARMGLKAAILGSHSDWGVIKSGRNSGFNPFMVMTS